MLMLLLLLLRAYGIAAVRSHPAFDSAPLSLRLCPCCLLLTFCIALISSCRRRRRRRRHQPYLDAPDTLLSPLPQRGKLFSSPQSPPPSECSPPPLFLWHVRRVSSPNQNQSNTFFPPLPLLCPTASPHTQSSAALASAASNAFACVLLFRAERGLEREREKSSREEQRGGHIALVLTATATPYE